MPYTLTLCSYKNILSPLKTELDMTKPNQYKLLFLPVIFNNKHLDYRHLRLFVLSASSRIEQYDFSQACFVGQAKTEML